MSKPVGSSLTCSGSYQAHVGLTASVDHNTSYDSEPGQDSMESCGHQVSARTWAVLQHRLKLAERPPAEAAAAVLLRGLMELCIYGGTGRGGSRGCCRDRTAERRGGKDEDEHLPVPWSCTDGALLQV